MADRVDPAVDRMEVAGCDPPLDLPARHAPPKELASCDQSVPSGGEAGDKPVNVDPTRGTALRSTFATTTVVNVDLNRGGMVRSTLHPPSESRPAGDRPRRARNVTPPMHFLLQ